MNLGSLKAEVGRLLGDPSHDRWSEAIKTTRLNLSMSQVLLDSKALKTLELLTPVASTEAVAVDTDTIDIVRITVTRVNGDIKPLDGISREELDYRHPNWQNQEDGEPIAWWWDGTAGEIHLFPKADVANAITNGLRVWGVLKPADMVSDSDVPFDGNTLFIPYHMAPIHWTVAQCWMDDGTPEALSKARFHRSNNMDDVGEYEKFIKKILGTFDRPVSIPSRILWNPQGGRVGGTRLSKGNPLGLFPFF